MVAVPMEQTPLHSLKDDMIAYSVEGHGLRRFTRGMLSDEVASVPMVPR